MRLHRCQVFVSALFGVSFLVLAVASLTAADLATIYASTWGPAGRGHGHVWRYESGQTWTRITPLSGLGDAVWDLAYRESDESVWAVTHEGPPSVEDPDVPHGDRGRVFMCQLCDGTDWKEMSPSGGFDSAVTTVSVLDDDIYITVDSWGLFRYMGSRTWQLIDTFTLAGQAIVSDIHDGDPMLFIGQDNTDEFWMYDTDGSTPCGTPIPKPGAEPCQIPPGPVCSADCHPGSCIHAFTVFDDGSTGPLVYAGAFAGRMYRWRPSTRTFVQIDDVPLTPPVPFEWIHVQGLASYHGLLWAGMSDGKIWTTPDATEATYSIHQDYTNAEPVSEMVAVPEDDLLWIGFGGVPYRWAQKNGTSRVRTFDGTNYVDRSISGQFYTGVLSILPVVPRIICDAGDEQTVECEGASTEVTLDASGTRVTGGIAAESYTWTGDFIEGTATGINPTVHFAGPGDYEILLTVTAGPLVESCTTWVHIVDTDPPVFEGAGRCLWPPNHRYRCFSAAELTSDGTGLAPDVCEGDVVVGIVGVSSSQPEDVHAGGDGSTQDDMLFDADAVCVRGERQGADKAGRTYTVELAATDASGNTTTELVSLYVPHDQSDHHDCGCSPCDVGLRPNEPLPLGPDPQEGTYPDP